MSNEIRSHILPLGFPLFLFEFPVLFQILHVDQELEEHQQQEADEEHTCHRACDDSDNAGGFWTFWRGEKSHKLLHRHVEVYSSETVVVVSLLAQNCWSSWL